MRHNNLASYILATHFRPTLLQACLIRLRHSHLPPGWRFEIVVAANDDDEEGRVVAKELADRVVLVQSRNPGGKLSAAFHASEGSLILVTGDDDMQSPKRLSAVIDAHTEGGAQISGMRNFRFLELRTGMVVRWDGPLAHVGAARSYDRDVLQRYGAWRDLPRGIDRDLAYRMENDFTYIRELRLPHELSADTVCTQHGRNIWQDRQFPPKGETFNRGEFIITGEGHHSELQDFPEDVRQLLGLS